jgi:hypothetical protein
MPDPDPTRATDSTANPYAPPEADLRPRARSAPSSFDPGVVFARAWEVYRRRSGVVVGVVTGGVMIQMLYGIAGRSMAETVDLQSPMGTAAVFVFYACGLVVERWLTGGQKLALLKLARGEPADVFDLFRGGPYTFRAVGSYLLCVLGVAVLAVPCLGPPALVGWLVGGSTAGLVVAIGMAAVGVVTFLVAWLALWVRISPYYFVIIDRDAGPLEALRESWSITRGYTVELLALVLVGAAVVTAGLLPGLVILCVAPDLALLAWFVSFFLTFPLLATLFACAYVALTGGPPREPRPEESPDIEFIEPSP